MKKHWYSQLKREGFEDIEKGMRIIDHKTIDDLAYRKDFQTKNQFEAKLSYFSWASQMAEQGQFQNMTDQLIWEYHSEGLSRRKISKYVDLEHSWCSRKITQIREYLMMSTASQCAQYG